MCIISFIFCINVAWSFRRELYCSVYFHVYTFDDIVNNNYPCIRLCFALPLVHLRKLLLLKNALTASQRSKADPEIQDRGDEQKVREECRQRPSSGFDGQRVPSPRKFWWKSSVTLTYDARTQMEWSGQEIMKALDIKSMSRKVDETKSKKYRKSWHRTWRSNWKKFFL